MKIAPGLELLMTKKMRKALICDQSREAYKFVKELAIMKTILVFAIALIASSESLKCFEGFNASVSGVPFYHWAERECSEKSQCFSQELEARIFTSKIKVLARYSGCISSAYSPLVTCERLFGSDSDLDPALLFDMIPDLSKQFQNLLQDMNQNLTEQFQLLFSDGKGTESFVRGWFTFVENLGFNLEQARPLVSHLAKLFEFIYQPPDRYGRPYGALATGKQPHPVVLDTLNALGDIDTVNQEIAAQLYSFLENFLSKDQVHGFEQSIYSPVIENLPDLVKSILPESWKPETWFDYIFETLGNVDFKSPKTSTIEVIKTIKKAVKIPEKYNRYFDPIFDTLPDLVEQLMKQNVSYVSGWSLELLKAESTVNEQTQRLSAAVEAFYAGILGHKPNDEMLMLFKWLPGLFYNLFEGKTMEIDAAYSVMSESIEAMNFQNLTETLRPTKMSDFIIMMMNKTGTVFEIGPGRPFPTNTPTYELPGADFGSGIWGSGFFDYDDILNLTSDSDDELSDDEWSFLFKDLNSTSIILQTSTAHIRTLNNFLIINLSRLLYNLLPEYEEQLDSIFTTLLEGFHNFPVVNAGKIIKNLIIDLGWEVPKQIQPILDHLQPLLNTTYNQERGNFQIQTFKNEILNIVETYDEYYPNSQLPHAVRQLANAIFKSITEAPDASYCYETYLKDDWKWDDYQICYREWEKRAADFQHKIQQETNEANVDLQFAIFNEMDRDDIDPFFQSLIDAIPHYAVYIRLMRAMDPSDVKALMKDYNDWMFNVMARSRRPSYSSNNDETPQTTPQPDIVDSFVKAMSASIARITSKLQGTTKELRSLFAPDSCKYDACDTDLCNKHQKVIAKKPITPDPKDRRLFLLVSQAPTTESTSDCRKMAASTTPMFLTVLLFFYKFLRQ